MKHTLGAITFAGVGLVACGGNGSATPEIPLEPTAKDFSVGNVGKTLSLTQGKVAELAEPNFTLTSITASNGEKIDCRAVKQVDGTYTLVISPKIENSEEASGDCKITLTGTDANSAIATKTVTVTGANIDSKAPTWVTTPPANIAITAGTAGSVVLPTATDMQSVIHAVANLPTDGSITFDPATRILSWTQSPPNATLTYSATDPAGNVTTATLSAEVNHPPVAVNDTASVDAGGSVIIPGPVNDTDADGNTLSIGTFEQPASGGTVSQSGNTLIFTSNGTPGTYTFRYWAYDGKVNSLTPATVTVTVNPVAPPPCDPNTDPNCGPA